MAGRRKKDGAAPKPRRAQPATAPDESAPVAAAPAPEPASRSARSEALREYRFTRAHRHAGRDYRPGDIVELTPAAAAHIRAWAGAGVLAEWEG